MPGTGGVSDYVSKTRESLDRITGPAILVAHSQGGVVITSAAEMYAEKMAGLVYVSAFLPRSGQSIVDILRENNIRMPLPYLEVSPDRKWTTARLEGLQEYIYHDCPPEYVARARRLIRPEPMSLSTERVMTTAERYGRIPRAYVECLEDRAIPVTLQRAMNEATPCSPVLELEGGHSRFLVEPAQFVTLLEGLAENWTKS